MAINPRNIFWLDAMGAALSMCLIGLVLPALEAYIGMPAHVLYWLTLYPLGCLSYDAFCLWRADLSQPRWLKGIMLANSLYCVLTIVLVALHYEQLTAWGVAYFVSEIPVIGGLVLLERRVLLRGFPKHRG